MQDLKNLTLRELEEVLKTWGKPSFHASQIFSWVYKRQIKDFAKMSDLPLDLRKLLKDNFYLYGFELIKAIKSVDGSEKLLLRLNDKNFIETTIIPTERHLTGCISSQAGCKFACGFCASGMSGFKRNLTTGEIIEQALFIKDHLPKRILTHIVFMGIGEPLDNYDNVLKAVRIINAKQGLNLGARRITISTCGIIPGIRRLLNEDLQIELSVSLHASEDKTRSKIMPINKKYTLREIIKTCKEYSQKTHRQITFEYILISGINSDLPSALNLSKILSDIKLSKVNLIPVNPLKERNLMPPNHKEILLFRDTLLKNRINVTLRRPRGQDIEAACGQLRLRYEDK